MTKSKKTQRISFYYSFLIFSIIGISELHAEKMIILKGIKSLLDVPSAVATAKKLGYEPVVIKASGENYSGNPQVKEALDIIRKDPEVVAIYGFSGGGYNTRNLYRILNSEERKRIKRIVVLGSPGVTRESFPSVPIVDIVPNSPKGHMDTPRWWLEKQK